MNEKELTTNPINRNTYAEYYDEFGNLYTIRQDDDGTFYNIDETTLKKHPVTATWIVDCLNASEHMLCAKLTEGIIKNTSDEQRSFEDFIS